MSSYHLLVLCIYLGSTPVLLCVHRKDSVKTHICTGQYHLNNTGHGLPEPCMLAIHQVPFPNEIVHDKVTIYRACIDKKFAILLHNSHDSPISRWIFLHTTLIPSDQPAILRRIPVLACVLQADLKTV